MNGTERLRLRTKKRYALISNVQKLGKSQPCISWLPTSVQLTSLMVNFSHSGRVDMVILYGVADGNARLTGELWIERFPNRAYPCARTFASVVQLLWEHGTLKFQVHDCARDRTERILQAEAQILERVEEEPDISTRRRAAEVGVSQFVVQH